jgi:hypothetical protein
MIIIVIIIILIIVIIFIVINAHHRPAPHQSSCPSGSTVWGVHHSMMCTTYVTRSSVNPKLIMTHFKAGISKYPLAQRNLLCAMQRTWWGALGPFAPTRLPSGCGHEVQDNPPHISVEDNCPTCFPLNMQYNSVFPLYAQINCERVCAGHGGERRWPSALPRVPSGGTCTLNFVASRQIYTVSLVQPMN